jgi:hypothetical protein
MVDTVPRLRAVISRSCSSISGRKKSYVWDRDGSVGIATDYGLGGPGSNPVGDEIFRPSRPALDPTQSPSKWVPGLSRGQGASGACC